MGSSGAGKGKSGRPNDEKQHAREVNAARKAQGKTTKSVASVSRSKTTPGFPSLYQVTA